MHCAYAMASTQASVWRGPACEACLLKLCSRRSLWDEPSICWLVVPITSNGSIHTAKTCCSPTSSIIALSSSCTVTAVAACQADRVIPGDDQDCSRSTAPPAQTTMMWPPSCGLSPEKGLFFFDNSYRSAAASRCCPVAPHHQQCWLPRRISAAAESCGEDCFQICDTSPAARSWVASCAALCL